MQANDTVQDFTLQDQDGHYVSLSDFRSSPVVLFFYPRADTPGCTIEACGFRDSFEKLKDAGAIVIGISRDTVKAQKRFGGRYDLNYPLLADAQETVCNYFGTIKPKSMYGKLVSGIERTTFVIAPSDVEGHQRVLHVFSKVKPGGHAEEVLALLQKTR